MSWIKEAEFQNLNAALKKQIEKLTESMKDKDDELDRMTTFLKEKAEEKMDDVMLFKQQKQEMTRLLRLVVRHETNMINAKKDQEVMKERLVEEKRQEISRSSKQLQDLMRHELNDLLENE